LYHLPRVDVPRKPIFEEKKIDLRACGLKHFRGKVSEMTLTEQIKKQAIEGGFVCVGITSPEVLRGLPHGRLDNVISLRYPHEELKNVNSVILLGHYVWDKSFNLAVDSTYLKHHKNLTPKAPLERYQLYYEVLKNKAWKIVEYLINKGYETRLSLSIPLKTSAVKSGLGCQGKNTLLLTPKYGPRIRLIAVLTRLRKMHQRMSNKSLETLQNQYQPLPGLCCGTT
jgi:epoxyqueuosine reductase QueG